MSQGRGTKESIAITLRNLQGEAIAAGLMTEAEQLSYEKGSPINGVAPGVWIIPAAGTGTGVREADGGYPGRRVTAAFLPRFNTKHTGKDVELALDAAYGALFAVNRKPKP